MWGIQDKYLHLRVELHARLESANSSSPLYRRWRWQQTQSNMEVRVLSAWSGLFSWASPVRKGPGCQLCTHACANMLFNRCRVEHIFTRLASDEHGCGVCTCRWAWYFLRRSGRWSGRTCWECQLCLKNMLIWKKTASTSSFHMQYPKLLLQNNTRCWLCAPCNHATIALFGITWFPYLANIALCFHSKYCIDMPCYHSPYPQSCISGSSCFVVLCSCWQTETVTIYSILLFAWASVSYGNRSQ